MRDVVARQSALGLDVVNDGEYGKSMRTRLDYGAWISYVIDGSPDSRTSLPQRR